MAAAELKAWVAARGLPAYRGEQLARRLWQNPVGAWADATEVPLELRQQLDAELPLARLETEVVQTSSDGTRKYLWRLADGEKIESVLIPTATRRTLCISSQAGCALGCTFCATGLMGFRRNLHPSEIAGQVREVILRNPADKPTNIVFMGMGEPLLNWSAVDITLSTLNQPEGLGIGARHITVSTVGIVPGMKALAARPEQFRLAISLHSPHAGDRIGLMPIEKKYPLRDVLQAAEAFRKRITFEYVMIAGRNDRDEDVAALISLARRLGAHVNLLPLHPGGDPALRPTGTARIREFREQLSQAGVEAVVLRSRGLDIDAACGQLHVKMAKRERRQQEA
jgi:23S rRNA (adenine2503-C2)-methyltransferase